MAVKIVFFHHLCVCLLSLNVSVVTNGLTLLAKFVAVHFSFEIKIKEKTIVQTNRPQKKSLLEC